MRQIRRNILLLALLIALAYAGLVACLIWTAFAYS
jgi:hypothetical protein